MEPRYLVSHLKVVHKITTPSEEAPPDPQPDPQVGVDALQALKAELTAVQAELAQVGAVARAGAKQKSEGDLTEGTEGSYPWQFYRRPPEGVMAGRNNSMAGWITFAPGGVTAKGHRAVECYASYQKKGLIPFDKYGTCPVPNSSNASESFNIILSRGGVEEFPLSQVLAYGWHQRPPMRGLKFPQYERCKNDVLWADCPECELELWAVKEDKDMPHAFFMHLRTIHGYSRAEASNEVDAQGLPVVGRFAQQSDKVMSERADRLMREERAEQRAQRVPA